MVWGFFPVDPLSGEDKFYIFAPGKYKVGRKGSPLYNSCFTLTGQSPSNPNCLGTRFHPSECTHVLVEELMPFNEALVDAIVAEKPFVLTSWVELFAGKTTCNKIPSFDSYQPTMAVEGMHVKVVDPNTRKNCLSGYTFLLGLAQLYKYGDRLKMLLQQVGGANVLSIEDFSSDSQDLGNGENDHVVFVMPGGSVEKWDSSSKVDSYYKITELMLISSVLSGTIDRDNLIHPCEPGSSMCSTDETVVAESDLETETSKPAVSNVQGPDEYVCKSDEYLSRPLVSVDNATTGSVGGHETVKNSCSDIEMRKDKINESDNRNIDIIFSQNLIVQHAVKPSTLVTAENSGIINFKRFRKTQTHSGNSFNNLVPFDKYPYKDNGDGREEIAESLKEERRRKETEAIAEDLFHNEKGRRHGMAGSLQELFTCS